ncbi:MAG: helix-turn-helix domain-containing protein [Candidatus Pedobacter colombiensis]|uniref:Helix-turn-helix domain-containing protein n=1 Tax=Candidatus Pedobacter colombiensis TaxID=3121371 RepID=A0AAJ6B645_9SPHI|nr:helix-turn-helix domain-containing protein [Pedobacter sp.]WEK18469.1 MAG: helix-turn-helix domain-containing protein [Pedobacter sp.]
MKFIKIAPHSSLTQLVECYWMMQSDDPTPRIEKIIPDGFTELIFNYGSVYKAKINKEWHVQSPNLLAGQISSYFYLENTGPTGSFAIKLKPAALTQLFNLSMDHYLDKIVDLDTFPNQQLSTLKEKVLPFQNEHHLKSVLDNHFIELSKNVSENPIKDTLNLIFDSNGRSSVREMASVAGVGERQLERLFKKYIGLSPKYYARIIQFNYIFQLIKLKKSSWTEIVFQSGYYDQSHFIRNFKAFTGEDPSSYFFEEKNMANFFLNK